MKLIVNMKKIHSQVDANHYIWFDDKHKLYPKLWNEGVRTWIQIK